ncbi:glycosyltransferase [Ramlibacter solisilvae]|uniref:Uncharacterized protein n=1 Tax=Ramlibacter tataouinensis TaxID=94132 RepID=A0A127JT58_9BURK|nr:glycosyltransferase [Ramlibacter tataouinensis]AMO23125.1 hypothetical protein UC35_09760 [Ramlibacter tataouinensis]
MKRVAIFRADLLPISETFVRDQADSLARWQPVLVGRRRVEGGLPTPGIPHEIVPDTPHRVVSALRFWLSLPDPRLVAQLKALHVDLVHTHFGTDATEVWPSVKAAGLPMVVTLHGYDINIHREWWEAGHGGLRKRVYPRRLLQMAREPKVSFIAVSRAVKRRAIDYGIPEDKISTAYIGVDIRRFQPGGLALAKRAKRILFVGRMVEKKAPLLMIRAFAKVRSEVPDAELVMVGDGPLLAEAQQLAGELAVPVSFLGARSWDQVLMQMHEARVFCLPSVTAGNGDAEGLPISLLEAQATGVPVVTSARGGVDEGLQDGKTGIAFKEGAMDDLVVALRRLLCDSAAAARASVEAVQFAASAFDLRNHSRELESVYERLAHAGQH